MITLTLCRCRFCKLTFYYAPFMRERSETDCGSHGFNFHDWWTVHVTQVRRELLGEIE